MNKSKSIDALKGIAILGILLVHSRISFGNILNCVVSSGARGVQLMFIINGYLIFQSLERAEQKGVSLRKWYKRKFVRIIPLYWVFTVLHLLVFGRDWRFYLGPLEEVSGVNILCNLFCVHGFFPYYINSINVNWFIADLALWYILAPFVYKVMNSLKRTLAGIFVLVPIIYIFLLVAAKIPLISDEVIWNDYLSILCFLAELPIILLGCVIYWMEKENLMKGITKSIGYGGCFFALIGIAFLMIGSNKFFVFSNIFSFAICFAVIFGIQLSHPMKIICNSFFAVFGRYSYGIYLSHLFIIDFMWKILGNSVSSTIWSQMLVYTVVCLVALIAAVGIEKVYGRIVKVLIN